MAESNWDETIVLDLDHLSGFTGGDPDFECQVLDIFVENAPGYLDDLCRIEQENWKMTAHKLKGAARSIGAWRLARAAERAEKMPSPPPEDPRRTEITNLLSQRLQDLTQFIKSRQHALKG